VKVHCTLLASTGFGVGKLTQWWQWICVEKLLGKVSLYRENALFLLKDSLLSIINACHCGNSATLRGLESLRKITSIMGIWKDGQNYTSCYCWVSHWNNLWSALPLDSFLCEITSVSHCELGFVVTCCWKHSEWDNFHKILSLSNKACVFICVNVCICLCNKAKNT
jgi:hypothetical protein